MKRPNAGWITEVIKTEIKKKYIMSHAHKSIVDYAAKLQKEKEYKYNKWWFGSIIMKHSRMLEQIRKRPGTC